MKIKQPLQTFAGKSVLMIVTGRWDGVVYHAGDGEITELKKFRVPKPKYSDAEGFSSSKGRGSFRAGSERELNRMKLDEAFVKEAVKFVKQAAGSKKYDAVFVFSPPELKQSLPAALPYSLRSKIRGTIVGNYHEHHPFDLVKLADKKLRPAKWF